MQPGGEPDDPIDQPPTFDPEAEVGGDTRERTDHRTLVQGTKEGTSGHGTAPTGRLVPRGAEKAEQLVPGSELGPYTLKRVIGRGAQGKVWLAYNSDARREVALKFISERVSALRAALDAMQDEAKVLFDLTHPAIVRLFNIERRGEHLFLVMELIEGQSLQQHVRDRAPRRHERRRGLEVEECLWLLAQLAPALDYAAQKGVVHRDIKPGNIMLTKRVERDSSLVDSGAEVKLCDFGIAFVQEEDSEPGIHRPTGTPPYMAPEVLWGDTPTPRSDIYSLAATLFALHEGHPPHQGSTLKELQQRHRESSAPKIETGDAIFDAALARALARDPEARPATCDEFLHEASGGRMGRSNAPHSKVPKVIAAVSLALAAVATFVALDPFGLRRGQVRFLPLDVPHLASDAGLVVRNPNVPLAFERVSPGDEELLVGIGEERTKLLPTESGQDLYTWNAVLPGPGAFVVTVRAADGNTVLGSLRLVLDNVVQLAEPPIRLISDGPYDVADELILEFGVQEPDVRVRRIRAATAVRLPLDFDAGRARGSIRLTSDGVREVWTERLEHVFVDSVGNEATFPLDVEVHDATRILARLRAAAPAAAVDVHDWDLEAAVESYERWEDAVLADPTPLAEDRRRSLLAEREEVRRLLVERRNARATPRIEFALEGDDRHVWTSAGLKTVCTSAAEVLVQGRVADSRGPTLEARSSDPRVEILGNTEIDRDTGAFTLRLALHPEARARITLGPPTGGEAEVLEVLRDNQAPTLEVLTPSDGAFLPLERCPVACRVEDLAAGVRSVTVTAEPSGTSAPVALVRGTGDDGVWTGELPLPQDGVQRLTFEALDQVENCTRKSLSLTRDLTAAVLRARSPDGPLATGRSIDLALELDEPIEVEELSAVLRATGRSDRVLSVIRNGRATTEGEPSRREVLSVAAALPFTPTETLVLRGVLRDRAGNTTTIEETWEVRHDPYGALPEALRGAVEPVVDGDELGRLLGPDLAAQGPYWIDAATDQPHPRCLQHHATGLTLVLVPPGRFQLGPPGALPGVAEQPGPWVSMSAYYIALTEVSVGSFRRVELPGESEAYRHLAPDPTEPVRTTRELAGRWCAAAGLELPSEAQWEYAASGPSNLDFPWGSEWLPERCRSGVADGAPIATSTLAPVDAYPLGRAWCGALNMTGNVAEMCADDCPADSVPRDAVDPTGVSTVLGGYISRGGSARTSVPNKLSTYARLVTRTSDRDMIRDGFRPVLVPARRGP